MKGRLLHLTAVFVFAIPAGGMAELPVALQPQLPPRPVGAAGGTAFLRNIEQLELGDREAAIVREITAGNFPEFLRRLSVVTLHGTRPDGTDVTGTVAVMPDYLAVGSDDDFVRVPMTPQSAQRIAERFGCTLPTRKLVVAIDRQAEVRLEPRPLVENREAVATFLEHHRIIERQRAGKPLGLLVSGIKKDIALSPRLLEQPNRVALYGWHRRDGQPIQPLTTVHHDRYVDYSHGARLVGNTIVLDGEPRKITDLVADVDFCTIVSDEGPINPPRYPTGSTGSK